ncbi:MAG: preprotein translocase subunit SecE [Candidatus Pacebacteria bacterium]|nr:preprotein translocase subunit SecE [Candidatus Paceibacterota bacterium]MCD8508368.1 preprotein translocase subunit SecE [Candidatus Paceibacterota bacterium]MCD8528383.1 preprotein translocase subunit SecE [Candidatus Paceibacterota bacterium]MCD8563680.1 preprotein translocase subunit SecE [Candidatus Paceibacterota bacterium]
MNLIQYFKGVFAEIPMITWPTRRQTAWLTAIVIIISVIAGYYLGLFDFIFARVLELIIS